MRIGFKRKELKFINIARSNACCQRYIKLTDAINSRYWIKIRKANFHTVRPAGWQEPVVKAFSISHTVALFIKQQQGNEDYIYICCSNGCSIYRLGNSILILFKH